MNWALCDKPGYLIAGSLIVKEATNLLGKKQGVRWVVKW